MVTSVPTAAPRQLNLSVLALSSRFDGRNGCGDRRDWLRLSVLALSSRFDGPTAASTEETKEEPFSTRSVESF